MGGWVLVLIIFPFAPYVSETVFQTAVACEAAREQLEIRLELDRPPGLYGLYCVRKQRMDG